MNSWIKGSTVIFLLVVSLLASHTATGWLQDTLPDAFPEGDPTLESLNWNDLPLALREQGYLSSATKGKLFVAANNWIDAGKIGYALGGSLPVVNLSNEPHHFPFMLDLAELKGKDALIIGRDKNMLNAADEFKPYFDSIARVGEITLSRYGRQEMTLVVFYARNFHGEYPLPYGQKNP